MSSTIRYGTEKILVMFKILLQKKKLKCRNRRYRRCSDMNTVGLSLILAVSEAAQRICQFTTAENKLNKNDDAIINSSTLTKMLLFKSLHATSIEQQ